MAVTRHVRWFAATIGSPRGTEKLEAELNNQLANGERIVGTHYEQGYWWIITENYGLGPVDRS